MLPMRKSMPRSSRQLDHMKTSDDHKETQTAVVWSCYPFIRSGQNHLARHSERREKTRRTKKEVGRQHQGIHRPEVHQVPAVEMREKWRKLVVNSEVICGAPTTLVVRGKVKLKVLGSRDWTCRGWELWSALCRIFFPVV